MTIPAVGSITTFKKSSHKCPNCSIREHIIAGDPLRQWTQAEVQAALATMDFSHESRVWRSAQYHAWRAGPAGDADDLVQDAIVLALTTRKCSSKICIAHFITGIMRSLASGIVRKQEARMPEPGFHYPFDIEQVRSEAPSPAEELERQSRAEACQLALDTIAQGRPTATAIIDGIGQGLQGEALAGFAGVDGVEFSNVRRLIKRRAVALRPDLELWDDAA